MNITSFIAQIHEQTDCMGLQQRVDKLIAEP